MKLAETLKKLLQSVLERVVSNKLALNISKTKSIVFGTNHSLCSRPQLYLVMHCVAGEKVEEIKLLGVALDCKLSWSKHIDSMVVKMGRDLSLVLSNLDYCPVVWSSAARKDLVKLQLVQNRAARFALICNRLI